MKKLLSLILALIMMMSMAACSNEPADTDGPGSDGPDEPVTSSENSESEPEEPVEPEFTGAEINIGVLKGPTGMGAAWLMDQDEQGLTLNDYEFTVAGAADELTGRLVQGSLDIAALPTNAISSLYNKTEGKIVCLGVNTLGVLYILEKGESISSIKDLDGKTILASGQGTTAESVLVHLIAKNGIGADIHFASEHTEAATLALTGEYDIVMLPEPFVTNVMGKSADFRVALNISEEWDKLTGEVLTMGGIAVRKEFLEQNPEAVAEFIKDYGMSIEFTNSDPAAAGILIEKYGIATAAVAESAIPRCNIVWLSGDEYKTVLGNFLAVLFESNPASIGGAMPGEDFYG
ncbi:MAG: ABC transporter substrate-binding protein [Oscillospiraceae bacterium]|nr:ABC transporter substrate-binding protein [Oscillospiraceae bacterium]